MRKVVNKMCCHAVKIMLFATLFVAQQFGFAQTISTGQNTKQVNNRNTTSIEELNIEIRIISNDKASIFLYFDEGRQYDFNEILQLLNHEIGKNKYEILFTDSMDKRATDLDARFHNKVKEIAADKGLEYYRFLPTGAAPPPESPVFRNTHRCNDGRALGVFIDVSEDSNTAKVFSVQLQAPHVNVAITTDQAKSKILNEIKNCGRKRVNIVFSTDEKWPVPISKELGDFVNSISELADLYDVDVRLNFRTNEGHKLHPT